MVMMIMQAYSRNDMVRTRIKLFINIIVGTIGSSRISPLLITLALSSVRVKSIIRKRINNFLLFLTGCPCFVIIFDEEKLY